MDLSAAKDIDAAELCGLGAWCHPPCAAGERHSALQLSATLSYAHRPPAMSSLSSSRTSSQSSPQPTNEQLKVSPPLGVLAA